MPSVWLRAFFLGCLATAASSACTDTATKPEGSTLARTVAAQDDALAKTLAASRFEEDGHGGLIASAWAHVTKTRGLTFGAHLPASATGAFDLGLATKDEAASSAPADFALRVTHERFADAPLVNDAGRALYKDVAASTDVIVTANDRANEWFYVLRDAAAPSRFILDVELGKGIARATSRPDGSISFTDARAQTRLVMPRAYAVDARGTKRDVTLGWRAIDAEHGRLEVTLDPTGLAYPVLVDPALAYPLWEQLNAGADIPPGRRSAGLAYDSARHESILFGGAGAGPYLNDTWAWDGTTWSALSPETSPSGRFGFGMAYDRARGVTVVFGGSNETVFALADTWEWNGVTWTQRPLQNAPPARYDATMVYDSARGVSVLFGGITADNVILNDTWEYDGTTWTERAVATAPGERLFATMVYDSARRVSVLFGGHNNNVNSYLNDTWEWDGTTWAERAPATSPTGRVGAGMAYDSTRGKTVLFGGNATNGDDNDLWDWDGTNWSQVDVTSPDRGTYLAAIAFDSARGVMVDFGGTGLGFAEQSDTWEWNGTSWTQRAVGASPVGRAFAGMAYDRGRGRSVLFGGFDGVDDRADTWEWDGASWAEATPVTAPSARSEMAMTYDAARARTLLFGGVPLTFPQPAGNDTWTWDGTTWTELQPATSPPGRIQAMLSYDTKRSLAILFGGVDASGLLNDMWTWDGTTWTSQPITPPWPQARINAGMAYDSARDRTVLFGGNFDANFLYGNDTWEWDGSAWAEITTTSAPTARQSMAMAYDAARARTILFGGQSVEGNLVPDLNDTWEWDGTTWTSPSAASPPPRGSASMVYDTLHGALVFGGSYGQNYLNDTWLYVTIAASCTTTATCDSGSCVDGVCCAQSACGACQSCALPGQEGQCANVSAGSVPTTGDANTCANPNVCTATGVCAAPIGGTCATASDCYSGFCVDGVCCDSACDGACQACSMSRGLAANGNCAFAPEGEAGRDAACAGDFVCNGKGVGCPVTCTDDKTCTPGFFCAGDGTCKPQVTNGGACDDAAGKDCLTSACRECATGNCVNGACCASCTGTTALGAACSNDAQCLSNHCVGGTCCQDDCSLKGDGGSATCSQGVCSAALGYTCALPGNAAVCAQASCVKGVQSSIAACDGNGNCGAPLTKTCAPFACDTAACKATCVTNADCATGATCNVMSMQCEYGATCSSDGLSVVSNNGKTTSCAPYLCAGDTCGTSCARVSDCAGGFVCDPSGMCVANTATAPVGANSSGCSCAVIATPRTTFGPLAAWAAMALVALRRKRRTR